jgi:hypothetical protein
MVLTVNPAQPATSASLGTSAAGATPTLVLQPGTVVNAQVQNLLAENLVRIAIANLSIDVQTEVALTPGQNLQLAVSQTDNGIRLAVVGPGGGQSAGQGAGAASAGAAGLTLDIPVAATTGLPAVSVPSNDPLTPLQRIAVSVASESAAAQQQSLAPLFADLNAVATSNNLPPALREAVAQVLAQQTSLDSTLTGGDIEKAFQKSGLFLEAALASGAAPAGGGMPDLKAALIVLRQTLAAALGTTESPVAPSAASGDAKPAPATASPTLAPSLEIDAPDIAAPPAQLALTSEAAVTNPGRLMLAQALANGPQSVASTIALNLLQEALPDIRRAAGLASAATVVSPDGRSEAGTVRTNTPPPPFRGALPSPQPVAASSIALDAPFASLAHRLLDDTDAAIARQTLLQVASLPDRVDASGARIDQSMPRWNFEVPFATPQGTAMAQFEISRDGGGNEVEAGKRVWRARFSLDVEPAGPVHALISFSGERTSVRMWAERPATVAQLRTSASELSQALVKAELQPGDIVIREGAPPQPAPAKAGHFLDRAL